ncbi:RNA polymerase sigma factor [Gayadomonas joobiniege]|uniref:RNA polymerase sigma factor n=1 Tax=Gayadomonas joobiniege TaxID=1234606 RepID=UPI00037322E3|nr:sigma-70 family RNA polymerase sigma factor [Gayadomonas joobiniege]
MSKTKKRLFAQAMEQHKGIVFKVVNSYCPNIYDRQDLAQEILTTMWITFDNYDNTSKFSTWMYRIALNVAISYYRKDSKRADKTSLPDEQIVQIPDLSDVHQSEDITLLYQFITQLDELNKAIILLYLENESHETIANTLGISTSNVSTRLSRIKELLKKQFNKRES